MTIRTNLHIRLEFRIKFSVRVVLVVRFHNRWGLNKSKCGPALLILT